MANQAAASMAELRGLTQTGAANDIDLGFVIDTIDAWVRLTTDTGVLSLFEEHNIDTLKVESRIPLKVFPDALELFDTFRFAIHMEDTAKLANVAVDLFNLFGAVASRLTQFSEIAFSKALARAFERYEVSSRIRAAEELRRQAEELVASTRKSASVASEAATSASEAAGTTGENVMASYFESFGDQEWEAATRFRLWTIVLLAAGGVLAAVFLLLPAFGVTGLAVDAGDYVHLAQRVVVTAAVFALAAYLARQSHQHRTLVNWARAIAVQLKSFDAFMAPVTSAEAKELLRAQFAARVFGEPPILKGDAPAGESSLVPDKLWELLSKGFGKPE